MANFNFKELNLRLINSKVGQLDVKPMEVNSADTLLNILCQLALADAIQVIVVGDGARLMELTEELVDLIAAIVHDKLVPETACCEWSNLLEIIDDFLEVPGEGQHISMLLLIEYGVNTQFLVLLLHFKALFLLLFQLDLGCEVPDLNLLHSIDHGQDSAGVAPAREKGSLSKERFS